MQSRLHSFIESLTNVAIGYSVAIASQIMIFPLFGIDVSLQQNLMIGVFFTVISITRTYLIRRYFTRKTEDYWVWKPMDSAPRDGFVVDLINSHGHRDTDVWWTDDECWSNCTDDSYWVGWMKTDMIVPFGAETEPVVYTKVNHDEF